MIGGLFEWGAYSNGVLISKFRAIRGLIRVWGLNRDWGLKQGFTVYEIKYQSVLF